MVSKLVIYGLGALAILSAYWWATNSWPIIGMVGNKLVLRSEVDKVLYAQFGTRVIDGIVTQKQIESSLDAKNVMADTAEIDKKVEELKSKLPQGTKFEDELVRQGLTIADLKKLLGLQLRLEKSVSAEATVSAEEISKYQKDNEKQLTGKTAEEKTNIATEQLKAQKMDALINAFVEKSRTEFAVKYWPTYKMATKETEMSVGK